MATGNSGSVSEAEMQEIRQILEEVELAAQSGVTSWTNKRVEPRRRARLECKVRYLSPEKLISIAKRDRCLLSCSIVCDII